MPPSAGKCNIQGTLVVITMDQILIDFNKILEIPKWDKKARHIESQKWFKNNYEDLPEYNNLIEYINISPKDSKPWDTHFFKQKVIFPVCEKEIYDRRNIDAIKFILQNYHNHFLDFIQNRDTNLLKLGLEIDNNDIELLNHKFKTQFRYFQHTIHEVPWGVLYDMNGANIYQTRENLIELDRFEKLAKTLNEDITLFLNDCRFYYREWINYLSETDYNNSFEQYIKIKNH